MKRSRLTTAVTAGLIAIATGVAQAGDVVGTVSSIKGKAFVDDNGDGKFQSVAVGADVRVGNRYLVPDSNELVLNLDQCVRSGMTHVLKNAYVTITKDPNCGPVAVAPASEAIGAAPPPAASAPPPPPPPVASAPPPAAMAPKATVASSSSASAGGAGSGGASAASGGAGSSASAASGSGAAAGGGGSAAAGGGGLFTEPVVAAFVGFGAVGAMLLLDDDDGSPN
ncbi:MAG: hypothetical protein KDG50_15660 [Chromatiales bacterium]|nr:hypothetical protein [Chromatiales bacterium]